MAPRHARPCLAVTLAAILAMPIGATTAWALDVPTAGEADPRVRTVVYDPADVVLVVGTFRTITQIVFAEDETIVLVAIGDTFAWLPPQTEGNLLFIKPRHHHPPTNMQVVTSRPDGSLRTYNFEISSQDESATNQTAVFFTVRFDYPGDRAEEARLETVAATERALERARDEQAARASDRLETAVLEGPRNTDYTVQGSSSLEPAEAWDNGVVTVMRFPGGRDLPAIYRVNADGSEALADWTVEGDLVVIGDTAGQWVLRSGSDVACLYNEAYSAGGSDRRTGTVSGDVFRTLAPLPEASR